MGAQAQQANIRLCTQRLVGPGICRSRWLLPFLMGHLPRKNTPARAACLRLPCRCAKCALSALRLLHLPLRRRLRLCCAAAFALQLPRQAHKVLQGEVLCPRLEVEPQRAQRLGHLQGVWGGSRGCNSLPNSALLCDLQICTLKWCRHRHAQPGRRRMRNWPPAHCQQSSALGR